MPIIHPINPYRSITLGEAIATLVVSTVLVLGIVVIGGSTFIGVIKW